MRFERRGDAETRGRGDAGRRGRGDAGTRGKISEQKIRLFQTECKISTPIKWGVGSSTSISLSDRE
ncbi:MAG: hypothetical protein KME21_11545 [Desmonostoc vinosum HA7617-LM4]|nr:hypothetical protein [Desmonostoc vinosum HA7617-LM4]